MQQLLVGIKRVPLSIICYCQEMAREEMKRSREHYTKEAIRDL